MAESRETCDLSLKILAEHGLVDRDPLKRLVRETGARAHLSVVSGTAVLTVLSEGSGYAVQAAGWVGRSVPLHSTSTGRALLFDHTQEEIAELVHGLSFGGATAKAPRNAGQRPHRGCAERVGAEVPVLDEAAACGEAGQGRRRRALGLAGLGRSGLSC